MLSDSSPSSNQPEPTVARGRTVVHDDVQVRRPDPCRNPADFHNRRPFHSAQQRLPGAAARRFTGGMNRLKQFFARALSDERGMTTVEYAVGTIAAAAFAAILYKVVRSNAVQEGLSSLIQSALSSIS